MLKPHPLNLVLLLSTGSIYLPMFLGFPVHAPNDLIFPHLAFLALFTLSILVDIKKALGELRRLSF